MLMPNQTNTRLIIKINCRLVAMLAQQSKPLDNLLSEYHTRKGLRCTRECTCSSFWWNKDRTSLRRVSTSLAKSARSSSDISASSWTLTLSSTCSKLQNSSRSRASVEARWSRLLTAVNAYTNISGSFYLMLMGAMSW